MSTGFQMTDLSCTTGQCQDPVPLSPVSENSELKQQIITTPPVKFDPSSANVRKLEQLQLNQPTPNGDHCSDTMPSEIGNVNKDSFHTDFDASSKSSIPSLTHFSSPLHSKVTRRSTDANSRLAIKKNRLAHRYSFLAGHGSNSTLYSRLAYDFSSLDKKTIQHYKIKVREVYPTTVEECEPTSSISSPDKLTTVDSIPTTPVSNTSSEYGLASFSQETVADIKQRLLTDIRHSVSSSHPVPLVPILAGPRNLDLPYDSKQLVERLSTFNLNEFGLQASWDESVPPGDCKGQVRIHINLIRPIRMLLTVRPVSIFDVVGSHSLTDHQNLPDDDDDQHIEGSDRPSTPRPSVVNGVYFDPPKSAVTAAQPQTHFPFENQHERNRSPPQAAMQRPLSRRLYGSNPKFSTFNVPRGSTKLLHIRLSTTTREVITALLERFKIENDPVKFALYEHTIEGEDKVSVRKLFDDESPLGLMLRWTESGDSKKFNQIMGLKRLVLQENDSGDVEWSSFSLPELNTFVNILANEELEYERKVRLKYSVKLKELMRLIELKRPSDSSASPLTEDLTPTASEQDIQNHFPFANPIADSPQSSPTVVGDGCPNDPLSPNVSGVVNEGEASTSSTTITDSEFGNLPANSDHWATLPLPPNSMDGTDPKSPNTHKILFKPSPYKQMKKASKSQKKLQDKLIKKQNLEEKKRMKGQTKSEDELQHSRWFFGLFTSSSSSTMKR